MSKKLYKSSKNKMIFGVCSGFAEYLNIDPTIVRLVFIILCFFKGIGAILYLICGLIMPNKDKFDDDDINVDNLKSANMNSDDKSESKKSEKSSNKKQGAHSDEDFDSYFKK